MPEEVRTAIVEALRAPRATVASVTRAFDFDRKTIRRIRDESGIEPAKKGRRKVEK
jgi:transposase-like protein